MAMNMKVKRVALIEAIKQTAKREAQRFVTETAKKKKSDEENRKKYVAKMEAYVADVRNGGDILDHYELDRKVTRKIAWQGEPAKARDFDCLIEKLNLATDDILTVDSKSEFFSFIKCKC